MAKKDLPSGAVGEIESAMFRRAELESERIRVSGVLSFIAIFIIVTLVRVFVIRTAATATPWAWQLGLAIAVAIYEAGALQRVNRALKSGRTLHAGFWVFSTIVETSIPAFAIAFLASPQIETAYRPLASPAILIFFIFIILSTLRLHPWICVLSGAVASVTYLSAAWYLGWRLPVPGIPTSVTQNNVNLNAIILFTGGIVAGAVAREIRKHVDAALREAETKRQLEAVEHDLQVARSIQRSLLPKGQPQIEGFEIAAWNQPADDTGGDYYDWKTHVTRKWLCPWLTSPGTGLVRRCLRPSATPMRDPASEWNTT